MFRFAVIGEIGSGKSYVAKQFGCPVFNADFEVSKLYKKDKKCFLKIKKALPNHITSFPVRKSELSRAIISNKSNLKKIIKIIHPKIRKKMNNFIKKNKNKRIVVLDIPLLIENRINKKSDIIIFVDASKKEIKRRLKKRKDFNPKIISILKKFQLPVEEKKRKSDFIIKNNFNNSVKKNVKKVLGDIFK
tara:strand:+ start:73 stop:642 length:570 start_codon:yes stop_codon:yes gene_type:complete